MSGVGDANPDLFLRFRFRQLDDGILCFDSASGETSLLPDAGALLNFLGERSGLEPGELPDRADLLAHMGLHFDC